jgi:hypothetical protein
MQYHYVVLYDENTDKFEIDVDTSNAVFFEGTAFNPDTQTWYGLDELMEADYLDYEQMLSEKLGS